MTLANRKEFQDAGFHLEDTTIALVWSKELTGDREGEALIIYSEVRSELDDSRPQDEWEPCAFYTFDGLEMQTMGRADTPLRTIAAALEAVGTN